jgi:inner membrane protein
MAVWLIWLIIAVVLLIAEMTTFTFYLLWLGLGAVAGTIVAAIAPDAWLLQLIVAGFVAIVLTFTTKPLTTRFQGKLGYQDPIDDLVGREGEVVEEIAAGSLGIVKVGTETWSAKSDIPLAKGEKVIVKHRSTTVMHVTKSKGV